MQLGIDMGGTNTAIGLTDGLKIINKTEFKTDTSGGAYAYAGTLCDCIFAFLKENNLTIDMIDNIGMGIPGSANQDTGMIEYANNLGFENVPFKSILEEKLNRTVKVDNDANLAAYGEYLLSKGKSKSFIMVTLGTGIGGGIILNGEIYRGINFAEGEIGHMTIKYDGIQCNCGRRGCFEAYASTNALIKMACDAMRKAPNSIIWKHTRIDGRAFFEAVKEKDAAMLAVLHEYTDILSEGLANIINIFQPEEMVIGGGISGASELFLSETIEKVSKKIYSKTSKKNTVIRTARFANDAGIVGAANL